MGEERHRGQLEVLLGRLGRWAEVLKRPGLSLAARSLNLHRTHIPILYLVSHPYAIPHKHLTYPILYPNTLTMPSVLPHLPSLDPFESRLPSLHPLQEFPAL